MYEDYNKPSLGIQSPSENGNGLAEEVILHPSFDKVIRSLGHYKDPYEATRIQLRVRPFFVTSVASRMCFVMLSLPKEVEKKMMNLIEQCLDKKVTVSLDIC